MTFFPKRFLLASKKLSGKVEFMAESLRLRVKCHACNYLIEGTAKYGSGHYVPQGVDFEFIAIGKVETADGKRKVKAEVICVCPSCGVKCKFFV